VKRSAAERNVKETNKELFPQRGVCAPRRAAPRRAATVAQ